MLSAIVLSVCPCVLSVTLVYCGQTVGSIKTKLGMEVGLGPGHILLDGDPAPPPRKWHSPQFLAHVCCGKTDGWIKMSLGTEGNLGTGPLSCVSYLSVCDFGTYCGQTVV